MSDIKTCTKCKVTKPVEDFCTDRSRTDGLTSHCKLCRKISETKYRNTSQGKKKHVANVKRYYVKKGGSKFRAETNLFRLYGVTPEQFNKLYVEQEGCCAICGTHQSEFKRALSVDHNHKTKVIRGLLCNNCNMAIGKLQENPILLRKAADYLDSC